MPRNAARWAGLLLALAPLAGASVAGAGDTADLLQPRWGRTPKGATRIVFPVSRPVEYLTVELPEENGFEVHLLDTDPASVPDPLAVGDGHVTRVTFRAGAAGIVARIVGGDRRLRAQAFRLENPPRVVVDVRPDDDAPAAAPSRAPSLVDATPVPARKAPTTPAVVVDPDELAAAESAVAEAGTGATDDLGHPEDVATAAADSAGAPSGEDFQELLGWITGVKLEVEALVLSDTEADRARYRRSLAFLLAERGLLGEAEKTLTQALASDAHDPATAYSDSVYLAELRLRLGDEDGATEVARALPADRGTPREAVRLATVLSKCRFPDLARVHLEDTLPRLTGLERVDAQLLLAQIHWDRHDAAAALPLVAKLTESKHVPHEVLTSALILQADCVWSLGRQSEAESYYRRALALSPPPEEASWITLQLGNLAHRSGHIADAIDYYRRARDRWPDTFYGAQADWFLKVAEETERLQGTEVVRSRG